MMDNLGRVIFLEEWLAQNIANDSLRSPQVATPSSRGIIQAWTDLRDSLKSQLFDHRHLKSLKILCDSQNVLYVADPHAKLLVSILSLSNVSLPEESYPLFLRLLYIWVRKSSRQSTSMIDSVVDVLHGIVSEKYTVSKSSIFFSEGVLLLGATSLMPSVSEKSKTVCLDLLCKLCEEEFQLTGLSRGPLPSILGGIGYALSSSGKIYFVRLLGFLFGIWEKRDGPCCNVPHGLMILHLIEWVLSKRLSSQATAEVSLFQSEMLVYSKPSYSVFALLMAAFGVLRFISRSGSNVLIDLRFAAEKLIETVTGQLATRIKSVNYVEVDSRDSLLLQCISIATARCGSLSYSAPLALCLAFALLVDVFPLRRIYKQILTSPTHVYQGLLLSEVKEHLNSIIFKEAGAISGILCNQYIAADDESKSVIENLIWEFCQDIYFQHRDVALVLQDIKIEGLLEDLEKICESSFLMVVLFALAVTKYRLSPGLNQDSNLALSVKIMVSFSCLEYFRRMRLPEYMETIRATVVSVQEDESTCMSFIESMPSYDDLTRHKKDYTWSTDAVQTARLLFYMRVIPTCIEHVPTSVFRKVVAPAMFLYMGHTNVKVARAAHAIFVAFISSGKDDPNQGDRASLKEQLVFYYMKRSLEGYPEITPFEGMASGVAAVVRNFPAGSPSIYYCVDSVVGKASSMCSRLTSDGSGSVKSKEEVWEPCNKLFELLVRLLSLIDVQVLPSLMQQLAQMVVQLPKEGQNVILDQLFQHVAESDDVTRKPTFVSWLQSLSYLCSKDSSRRSANGMVINGFAAPVDGEPLSSRL